MRQSRSSGSARDEGGNVLIYPDAIANATIGSYEWTSIVMECFIWLLPHKRWNSQQTTAPED